MHREGPTEKLRRSASIPVDRVEGCLDHGRQTRIGFAVFRLDTTWPCCNKISSQEL